MDSQSLQALLQPAAYPHPVTSIELVETHISWVLLTGEYAYKIKKPVDFGFLDFSTLAKRKHCCEQELLLNRRFAPDLYLDVVPITSPPIKVGGEGSPLDYAVRMNQFDGTCLLDRVAERGELVPELQRKLGERLAHFHRQLESDPRPASHYGTPESILGAIQQNFDQIRAHLPEGASASTAMAIVAQIETWSRQQFERCELLLRSRRATGFVRDCHGDLHLGNIALIDNKVVFFDCIEFNPNLRIIDVVSELAFLLMDLEARGLPEAANCVLNTYLEYSGDFAGLNLLTFYKVYRAMVRAKVSLLETAGRDQPTHDPHYGQFLNYLQLAVDYTKPPEPGVAISHGLSGSGKSTVAGEIAAACGAIRVRSDVERKRLYGLLPAETSDKTIYTQEATKKTFHRLAELVAEITNAGFSCIVDATFLHHRVRQQFLEQARDLQLPFTIIDCQAPLAVLETRLQHRSASGDDASEATIEVMYDQRHHQEPLTEDELAYTQTFDTSVPLPKHLAILGGENQGKQPDQ